MSYVLVVMDDCCLYRENGGGAAAYGQHPMADTERAELIPEQAVSSSSSSVARTQRHRKAWRWLDIHIDRRIFSAAAVVSRVFSPIAPPQSSTRDQADVHLIPCMLLAAAVVGRESLHLRSVFWKALHFSGQTSPLRMLHLRQSGLAHHCSLAERTLELLCRASSRCS